MAWVKIPQEHHPLFHACLPRDSRVSTVNMFGGVAAKVNGQMFAGLFARGAIVKLSSADQKTALAMDGAAPFDPMGNGRVMRDTILLPESVMAEPQELRGWLRMALDYTAALPAKKDKGKAAAGPVAKAAGKVAGKVAGKTAAKKPARPAKKRRGR